MILVDGQEIKLTTFPDNTSSFRFEAVRLIEKL